VPIYDVDCVISAYRDYEQNTFAESILQDLYIELRFLIDPD